MTDAKPGAICDHEHGLCNHWDLLDRIRALEAQLKSLGEANESLGHACQFDSARAEKAEARVRELEDFLSTAVDFWPRSVPAYVKDAWVETLKSGKPAKLREARP